VSGAGALATKGRLLGIWSFALGYFAAYVPYSALVKAITSGLPVSMQGQGVSGLVILPATVINQDDLVGRVMQ
jgi:hypothetical protein